jgi:hypothetical protein
MLKRVAAVLVVVASTVVIFPGWADAGDPVGWRPVFSNSFDDAGMLPASCSAYDGAPEGAQAGYFRPEAVTVSDGHLRLALYQRTYAGKPFIAGELRCVGAVQQFGRYEFRARVPVGAGIASVALLRPVDGQAAQHGSQLEITARPGAEQALVSNGDGSQIHTKALDGPFSDWHTYVIEWAPSGFRVYVEPGSAGSTRRCRRSRAGSASRSPPATGPARRRRRPPCPPSSRSTTCGSGPSSRSPRPPPRGPPLWTPRCRGRRRRRGTGRCGWPWSRRSPRRSCSSPS